MSETASNTTNSDRAQKQNRIWAQLYSIRFELLSVLVLTLFLAAPLRMYELETIPPGLWGDEAAEGLDALSILHDGARPVFLLSNSGREAGYAYVVAAFFALLGRGLVQLRLASALLGLLAVPAAYLCAREFFNRRIAMFTALLVAVTPWPVIISRVGMRPIMLPFLAALTLYFAWKWLNSGRLWFVIGSGLCLGLSFYSYLPSRLLPAVLVACAIVWVLAHRSNLSSSLSRAFGLLLIAAIVAGLVASPLLLYFFEHPNDFLGRTGDVYVFNSTYSDPNVNPFGTVWDGITKNVGMYLFEGDHNQRHNVVGRPVFDAFIGIMAVLGLILCFCRAREPAYSALILWMIIMLVPGILSEGAPHYLRTVGMIPAVFMVPAIGLDWLWAGGSSAWKRRAPFSPRSVLRVRAILVIAIAASVAFSIQAILVTWPNQPAASAGFDVPKVEAARYFATKFASNTTPRFLGPVTAEDQNLQFLFPEPPYTTFGPCSLVIPPQGQIAAYAFTKDQSESERLLTQYVPGAALVQSFDHPAGFAVYQLKPGWTFASSSSINSDDHILDGCIKWRDYSIRSNPVVGGKFVIDLMWECLSLPTKDYHVFVHVRGPDGLEIIQRDSIPGGGYQPTSLWKAGETIVETYALDIPTYAAPGSYQVTVGLLDPSDGHRVETKDRAGKSLGSEIKLGDVTIRKPDPVPPTKDIPARTTFQSADQLSTSGELSLYGSTFETNQTDQGGQINLVLFWQGQKIVINDYDVLLSLFDRSDAVKTNWRGRPVAGTYNTNQLQPKQVVADRWTLKFPTSLKAGTYRLYVSLVPHADIQTKGQAEPLSIYSSSLKLGEIVINDRPHTFDLPTPQHHLAYRFGDTVELVGYDLEPTPLTTGQTAKLRLYWRCLRPMDEGYTVFTHLLDPQSTLVAQQDSQPGKGKFPTYSWVANEIIEDEYSLDLPGATPEGEYQIEIGMYLPATGARLSCTFQDGTSAGDRVLVPGLSVVAR